MHNQWWSIGTVRKCLQKTITLHTYMHVYKWIYIYIYMFFCVFVVLLGLHYTDSTRKDSLRDNLSQNANAYTYKGFGEPTVWGVDIYIYIYICIHICTCIYCFTLSTKARMRGGPREMPRRGDEEDEEKPTKGAARGDACAMIPMEFNTLRLLSQHPNLHTSRYSCACMCRWSVVTAVFLDVHCYSYICVYSKNGIHIYICIYFGTSCIYFVVCITYIFRCIFV